MSRSDDGGNVGEGTLGVDELVDDRVVGLITCEGVGVEVGVQLRVHQDRGVEEDGEGQVEVEREEGEVKEKRSCMTMG